MHNSPPRETVRKTFIYLINLQLYNLIYLHVRTKKSFVSRSFFSSFLSSCVPKASTPETKSSERDTNYMGVSDTRGCAGENRITVRFAKTPCRIIFSTSSNRDRTPPTVPVSFVRSASRRRSRSSDPELVVSATIPLARRYLQMKISQYELRSECCSLSGRTLDGKRLSFILYVK